MMMDVWRLRKEKSGILIFISGLLDKWKSEKVLDILSLRLYNNLACIFVKMHI